MRDLWPQKFKNGWTLKLAQLSLDTYIAESYRKIYWGCIHFNYSNTMSVAYVAYNGSHKICRYQLGFMLLPCFQEQCLLLIIALLLPSILETLEFCIDKGVVDTAPVWNTKLKAKWWKEMVKYILYASSNGSLRAVKYFIDKGKKPHIRYIKLLRILQLHHIQYQSLM